MVTTHRYEHLRNHSVSPDASVRKSVRNFELA
jgi:hypothetical protein